MQYFELKASSDALLAVAQGPFRINPPHATASIENPKEGNDDGLLTIGGENGCFMIGLYERDIPISLLGRYFVFVFGNGLKCLNQPKIC